VNRIGGGGVDLDVGRERPGWGSRATWMGVESDLDVGRERPGWGSRATWMWVESDLDGGRERPGWGSRATWMGVESDLDGDDGATLRTSREGGYSGMVNSNTVMTSV
jgi:hypothetical protein